MSSPYGSPRNSLRHSIRLSGHGLPFPGRPATIRSLFRRGRADARREAHLLTHGARRPRDVAQDHASRLSEPTRQRDGSLAFLLARRKQGEGARQAVRFLVFSHRQPVHADVSVEAAEPCPAGVALHPLAILGETHHPERWKRGLPLRHRFGARPVLRVVERGVAKPVLSRLVRHRAGWTEVCWPLRARHWPWRQSAWEVSKREAAFSTEAWFAPRVEGVGLRNAVTFRSVAAPTGTRGSSMEEHERLSERERQGIKDRLSLRPRLPEDRARELRELAEGLSRPRTRAPRARRSRPTGRASE